MPLCGGSREDARRTEEELEEERAALEAEARSLSAELQSSEAQLPSVTKELSAAEAWSRAEVAAAEGAEATRRELEQELAKLTRAAAAAGAGDLGAPSAASLSAGGRGGFLSEAHEMEAARLLADIASHEAEVERFRPGDTCQLQAIELAEAEAAEAQSEVAALRAELHSAEEEGNRLRAEQREAEKDQGPLHDWVQHVERELRLAGVENRELSANLNASLAHRAELECDEAEAQTLRRAGLDIMAVSWLREHQGDNAARKGALVEEIAAERLRQQGFVAEAAHFRENHQAGSQGSMAGSLRTSPPHGAAAGARAAAASPGRPAAPASPLVPALPLGAAAAAATPGSRLPAPPDPETKTRAWVRDKDPGSDGEEGAGQARRGYWETLGDAE